MYCSVNVGRANCPAPGLRVQGRLLLGLHCTFSAVSFAVVRIPATSSVVLTLLVLNTWTIVTFGAAFLELFPAHTVFSGKTYLASCLISQTPKRWEHHPGVFSPVATAASTSSGSAAAHSEGGPERHGQCRQGEAQGKVLGWTGNDGTLECAHRTCAEVLSKQSGSVVPPAQRLVQPPTESRVFYTGAPPVLAEKRGLLARGRTTWWSALLRRVWLKRLEALAEVCEAKTGVGILMFLCCYRVEFSNYTTGQLFWQPWSCFTTTNPQDFFIIVTPWSSLSVFLQVSLLVPSLNCGWLLSLTTADGGVPYCLGHH